jgi:hypothetical protein
MENIDKITVIRENKMSYADFAVAMIDDVINKKYINKAISVLGE